jgi:hypothetical protein
MYLGAYTKLLGNHPVEQTTPSKKYCLCFEHAKLEVHHDYRSELRSRIRHRVVRRCQHIQMA